jgi:hypothetical protein
MPDNVIIRIPGSTTAIWPGSDGPGMALALHNPMTVAPGGGGTQGRNTPGSPGPALVRLVCADNDGPQSPG